MPTRRSALKKTEADLAALRAGVDPDALADPLAAVDPIDEPEAPAPAAAPPTPDAAPTTASTPPDRRRLLGGRLRASKGLSFRKLAGAASGKKNREGDSRH